MAGEPADFAAFATARGGQLFRTAFLLTGDWHLAEDMTQTALGKIYRSWRRVRRADSPAAYAQTVLVRTCVSHQRKRSSGERPVRAVPDTAAVQGDPALTVALMEGLARLSPRDRAILVLRYWEDRSIEQTAETLRISSGAVRTGSMRALSRLRAVLGDDIRELAGP